MIRVKIIQVKSQVIIKSIHFCFSVSAAQSILYFIPNERPSIQFPLVNLIFLSPSGLCCRETAFSRICLVFMVTGLRQTQKTIGPNPSTLVQPA